MWQSGGGRLLDAALMGLFLRLPGLFGGRIGWGCLCSLWNSLLFLIVICDLVTDGSVADDSAGAGSQGRRGDSIGSRRLIIVMSILFILSQLLLNGFGLGGDHGCGCQWDAWLVVCAAVVPHQAAYADNSSDHCGRCGTSHPRHQRATRSRQALLDVLPQVVGDGFLVALHLGLQLFYPVVVSHRGFVDIGESFWPAVAWLAAVVRPRSSPGCPAIGQSPCGSCSQTRIG